METGESLPVSNDNQPTPPTGPNNRLFIIIAGIIAGLMLLTIAGMSLYAFVILPRQRSAEATQIAMVDAQDTEAAISADLTIQAMMWTQTPSVTPVPATDTPTPIPTLTFTPVVVIEEETEEIATPDPATVTAEAELTAAAEEATPTSTESPPTATVEPATPTATVEPATPTPTVEPVSPTATQTVSISTPTVTPQPVSPSPTSTPSALPETGSNIGSDFPLILLLVIGLVVVIVFSRKLRLT